MRHRRGRLFVVASLVTLTSAVGREAAADPQKPGPAFGTDAGEAGLALASAASLSASLLPQREGSWAPSHEAPFDAGVSRISDFTGAYLGALIQLTAGAGLEIAYLGSHGEHRPGVGALRTLAVEAEAAALTGGLTYAVKRVAGRCRPRAWRGGACEGGEYDAFPSGHTSPLGAMGATRLVSIVRSGSDDDRVAIRWTSFVLAESTMVTTGILRVVSSSHSWEDVVAGGLLGHLTGVLVALAHPSVPLEPATTGAASSSMKRRETAASSRGAAPSPPIAVAWATAF